MSTYTRLPGLSQNNEYGFRRVVIVAAIVTAALVVGERGAVAGRQLFIDEKAVCARVVASAVRCSADHKGPCVTPEWRTAKSE